MKEELWPTTLPGWQAGDSRQPEDRCFRSSTTMFSTNSSIRRSILMMSMGLILLFSSLVQRLQEGWKEGCVSLFSTKPHLITDRKVFKIKMWTEPMMREEQVNYCTSSGALPQLFKAEDKDDNSQTVSEDQSSSSKFRRIQEGWRSTMIKPTYTVYTICTQLGCLIHNAPILFTLCASIRH